MNTHRLVLILMAIASPISAQTSNLCALLPEADVSAIAGAPLKLSAQPGQTYRVGGGTVRDEECVYDTPGGGFGPTTVRVGISEASSPTLAAQWFKEQASLYDRTMAGKDKGQPLKGIADEGFAYPTAGAVYLRRQSLVIHITVARRDLDSQKAFELSKQLAQKVTVQVK